MEAIINSMTPGEQRDPEMISGSRKPRIALGSGTQVQDVGRLIKQHKQMQMMKKVTAKGGMAKMMRGMGGMFPGHAQALIGRAAAGHADGFAPPAAGGACVSAPADGWPKRDLQIPR